MIKVHMHGLLSSSRLFPLHLPQLWSSEKNQLTSDSGSHWFQEMSESTIYWQQREPTPPYVYCLLLYLRHHSLCPEGDKIFNKLLTKSTAELKAFVHDLFMSFPCSLPTLIARCIAQALDCKANSPRLARGDVCRVYLLYRTDEHSLLLRFVWNSSVWVLASAGWLSGSLEACTDSRRPGRRDCLMETAGHRTYVAVVRRCST